MNNNLTPGQSRHSPGRPLRDRAFTVALCLLAGFAALVFCSLQTASAQAVSDTFSNLSVESDQPVKIEADQLEVSDNDKVAVFSGNVLVKQGTTMMRTSVLKVFYMGEGTAVESGGSQRVSKLEATGKVVVNADGQTATGDWAVFDMATQEVKLGGKVILSQGKSVLRGTELVVNLKTGKSKLVSASPQDGGGGRVQGLLFPAQ